MKRLLLFLKFWGWYKEAKKIKEKKGAKAMLEWLKKKLKEPSTYAAIVALLGYAGLQVGEGVVSAVCGVILGLVVLYEAIRDEKKE